MTAIIGEAALWIALAAAVGHVVYGVMCYRHCERSEAIQSTRTDRANGETGLLRFARNDIFPLLQLLGVAVAFSQLMIARVQDDFSLVNVADHSNRALPMLYKITGTWGNHEGSMLLWVLVLTGFGYAIARNSRKSQDGLFTSAGMVQSLLAAGFLLFILLTSNPFLVATPAPPDGAALNPLLQDVGLAIHPPLLYVGYVGFSAVFSLAIAGLWQSRIDKHWAQRIRPFLLVAWSFLTLGIGMGSWWAYRELGWGGWWFWDPVENASLLPWLTGTALLHSTIALQKRGVLARWVALLAILTFAMSLLGTFLVRSGVLTSVHSFASDPARGMYVLIYMALTIGGGLLLYAIRSPSLTSERAVLISREGGMAVNNLFMVTACATVALGTLYPLLTEWLSGARITVGAPFFNLTAVPLMILPIILAGIAPLLPWGGGNPTWKRQLAPAATATLATAFILLASANRHAALTACGGALAAWLALASVTAFKRQVNHTGFKRIAPSHYAVFLAHLGMAILVAGVTFEALHSHEVEGHLTVGGRMVLDDYTLVYEEEQITSTPNYLAKIGTVSLRGADGNHLLWLYPEFRFYPISGTSTSEAAIYSRPWGDIYVVIGEAGAGDSTAIRAYSKPMMQWIWAAFLLMAAGGFAGLFRRK